MNKKGMLFFTLLYSLSIVAFTTLQEQWHNYGYYELIDVPCEQSDFDELYDSFDQFIVLLQKNTAYKHMLLRAKQLFIKSGVQDYYSTHFFGLYDESNVVNRSQVSFYYADHFDAFLKQQYPALYEVPEINYFFMMCKKIVCAYQPICSNIADVLNIQHIFISDYQYVPLLIKVVKYLPEYKGSVPHYDGAAFSLNINNTVPSSLFLAPYKKTLHESDFFSPNKTYAESVLVLPGLFLQEFDIFPTPHVVVSSNQVRYAVIGFAMRPQYTCVHNQCVRLLHLHINNQN